MTPQERKPIRCGRPTNTRVLRFSPANWTWTPNSTWVNEARVGYSHYFQQFLSEDSTQNPANYTFNGTTYNFATGQNNPLYFGFPGLVILIPSAAIWAPVGPRS